MFVGERDRVRYDDYDYDYRAREDRFERYDYESEYEEERNHTSSSYRDSLMSSLERPSSRSRLERTDDARYGFYRSNIEASDNNYDRFWDSKRQESAEKAPVRKRKFPFVAAYIAIALVAIIAVTLSVLGTGSADQTVVKKNLSIEPLSASAESATDEKSISLAALEAEEEVIESVGGENYIMVNGELLEIAVPEQQKVAKEEEKGFDKFCSWLNGVFGG